MTQLAHPHLTPVIRLAWLNLWRTPLRTLLVLLPIGMGLAAIITLWSLNDALRTNIQSNFQRTLIGSLQIHRDSYFSHPRLDNYIRDVSSVTDTVTAITNVPVTTRLESFAMVAAEKHTLGMMLIAVDPVTEPEVTNLHRLIDQGRFFTAEDRDVCIIGKGAASRLQLRVGDSLDLVTTDRFGAPVATRVRVIGILSTAGFGIDEDIVFLPLRSTQNLLEMTGLVTTVLLMVPAQKLAATAEKLQQVLSHTDLEVLTWQQMFPVVHEWGLLQQGFERFLVMILLILIAATVGNVFLVATLNRRRELQTLLAIGNRPWQIRLLLLCESLWISLLGVVVGSLLGTSLVALLNATGVDLSMLLGDTRQYYVDPRLHPGLGEVPLVRFAGITLLIAWLTSFYPAWRAGSAGTVSP